MKSKIVYKRICISLIPEHFEIVEFNARKGGLFKLQ
jgi:hypothetical protein